MYPATLFGSRKIQEVLYQKQNHEKCVFQEKGEAKIMRVASRKVKLHMRYMIKMKNMILAHSRKKCYYDGKNFDWLVRIGAQGGIGL